MHSIRVVPLPGNPRYYNSYLSKVRAVAGSTSHGVCVPGLPPATDGREGVPRRDLSTNIIFDLDKRPDDIPELQWSILNGLVYNALYLGCPDHMKHLFSRVPIDDGKAAVNSIRGSLGTVSQQKAKFSRNVVSNLEAFQEKSQYEAWFGELNEIHTHYNMIYQLPEADQWSASKLREDFTDGVSKFFPDIATSASSQPNLSIDDLHQLVLERLERLGISGLAATNSAGPFSSAGAGAPAVAHFGYDDGWSTWHGVPGFPGSQLDNYYDHFPGSYDGYPDDYSNGYDDYGPFDHAGQRNFSLWSNSGGHYDNWRPRRPSPYDRSSGSHFRSGGFHSSRKSKGKGKGKGSLGKGYTSGKGKGGRGFSRYTVSVLMTDNHTGEEFVSPRGETDEVGNLLVPSTDAQVANQHLSMLGTTTPSSAPSSVSSTSQTAALTQPQRPDPSQEVAPAGAWWLQMVYVSHIMAAAASSGMDGFRHKFGTLTRLCIDSGCNFLAIFYSLRYFPYGVSKSSVELNGVTGVGKAEGQGVGVCYAQTHAGNWIEFNFDGAAYQPECPVNLLALDTLHYSHGSPTEHEVNFKQQRVIIDKFSHVPLPRDEALRLHFMQVIPQDEFLKLSISSGQVTKLCF